MILCVIWILISECVGVGKNINMYIVEHNFQIHKMCFVQKKLMFRMQIAFIAPIAASIPNKL